MKIVLFVATALFLWPAIGDAAEPQTQAEITIKACNDFKQNEAKLGDIYKKITKQYSYDKVFIEHLEASQRAWAAYRNTEVNALYPPEYHASYGSIYSTCACEQLSRLTTERIKELNQWLEGGDERQVCHGTIRTK